MLIKKARAGTYEDIEWDFSNYANRASQFANTETWNKWSLSENDNVAPFIIFPQSPTHTIPSLRIIHNVYVVKTKIGISIYRYTTIVYNEFAAVKSKLFIQSGWMRMIAVGWCEGNQFFAANLLSLNKLSNLKWMTIHLSCNNRPTSSSYFFGGSIGEIFSSSDSSYFFSSLNED